MFNLKYLINTRLKYRILNKNFVAFKNFIVRLRYIVVNFEIINNVFSNKNKNIKIEKSQKNSSINLYNVITIFLIIEKISTIVLKILNKILYIKVLNTNILNR